MRCPVCEKFPVPTSMFEELEVSTERHGTLYRCKACGAYLEVIAEERDARFTPVEELRKYYPETFD